MKKRICSFFLIIVFVFGAGCSFKSNQEAVSGNLIEADFYYEIIESQRMDGGDIVQPEQRKVSVYSLEDLLGLYFRGPESNNLESPFPDGTQAVSISEEDGKTVLTMSGEFFTLTGINLSLASCCLSRTVCAYLNIDCIILRDELNKIQLEVNPESYELQNNLDADETSVYTVYFADSDGRYLYPEYRNVTLSESESAEAYVLDQLLQGPSEQNHNAVIPENTRILGISLRDSVCTVDFSEDAMIASEDAYQAYLFVFSVVNTLTELDGISFVQFEINGSVSSTFGCLSLVEPVGRYADAIGSVYAAAGETDVDVYMLDASGSNAFMMPVHVKQSLAESLAEAVISSAVTLDPPCGMVNPIPFGTKVLSVSVSENICYLDVSEDIIPGDDNRQAEKDAVMGLVATITNLDSINAVVLTINGESTGFRYIDLDQPLTVSDILSQ